MTGRRKSQYTRVAGPAVSAVAHALKSGRLTKSDCADCGGPSLQAHHHNGYEPEHALDVVWLCHPCHMSRHGRRSLPPWERHPRRYMVETRGVRTWTEKTYAYSDWTGPKRLLWHIENIWNYLRTPEERAAASALMQRLDKACVPGFVGQSVTE